MIDDREYQAIMAIARVQSEQAIEQTLYNIKQVIQNIYENTHKLELAERTILKLTLKILNRIVK